MTKYTDNKLAEELDIIILQTSRYKEQGFFRGVLGTLVYSYTGKRRPMFGEFIKDGKRKELALRLHDFRVLDPNSIKDVRLYSDYLKKGN